jgi:hypothetical protein
MAQAPANVTQAPIALTPLPPSNGYSKLASLMGAHPELATFRRFSTLAAQNLLYLQAELVFLENKLRKCVDADASSGDIYREMYDRDWQSLSESGATAGGNGEQWATVLRIRGVLKEYSACPRSHTKIHTIILTCGFGC